MTSREALGEAVRRRRQAANLTLNQLGDRLREHGLPEGTSVGHLSEVERGATWPSSNLVHALDAVLNSRDELIGLLREAKVPRHPTNTSEQNDFTVTAHLFFPLYVHAVPSLPEITASTPYDFIPRLGCHIHHDVIHAALHSFPFDVVVLHEAHILSVPDLVAIASWRQAQLERADGAVIAHADSLGVSLESADHEPYCFTAFVSSVVPVGNEARQHRANQLLSMPGALIASNDRQQAEALLSSSVPVTDVVDFSLTGSHFGSASWAAVAISLQSHQDIHGITNALIELEVQLQAFWCYASNVEAGSAVPSELHDARFLNRVLGKLNCPWPNEHTATRRLREALVSTSRVSELVSSAISASV